MKSKVITLTLRPELFKRIEERRKRVGISRSELIRLAVVDELEGGVVDEGLLRESR